MHAKLFPISPLRVLLVVFCIVVSLSTTQAATVGIDHDKISVYDLLQNEANIKQPNIILILTDDLNTDPATLASMKNLQHLLIEQGVSFSNAIVSVPSCCPSRASILTGKYAHNHRVATNSAATGGFPVFYKGGQEALTIGTSLEDAGYRTVLLGKYLNHYPKTAPALHIPVGWSEWFAYASGGLFNRYRLNENGVSVKYTGKEYDYSTDIYTAKAIDFIQRHQATTPDTPFFIMLNPYAPHFPAHPAPRHADLFPDAKTPRLPSYNEDDLSDKPRWVARLPKLNQNQMKSIDRFYRQQLRSLQAVDEMIGALVDNLAQAGQLENTYIIFTSDNGLHHGEHRIIYGKGTAYEEAIRVPLVVRGPGIAAGVSRAEVISLIDLAPTFAEIAGAPQHDDAWDGQSLLPLLSSTGSATSWRSAIFFASPNSLTFKPKSVNAAGNVGDEETETVIIAEANRLDTAADEEVGLQDFPYIVDDELALLAVGEEDGEIVAAAANAGGMAYHGFRTADYKYIEYKNGDLELYDLVNDPYELVNVASVAPSELLADLAAKLDQFRNCAGDSCRMVGATAPAFAFPWPTVTSTASPAADTQPFQIYLPLVIIEE